MTMAPWKTPNLLSPPNLVPAGSLLGPATLRSVKITAGTLDRTAGTRKSADAPEVAPYSLSESRRGGFAAGAAERAFVPGPW